MEGILGMKGSTCSSDRFGLTSPVASVLRPVMLMMFRALGLNGGLFMVVHVEDGRWIRLMMVKEVPALGNSFGTIRVFSMILKAVALDEDDEDELRRGRLASSDAWTWRKTCQRLLLGPSSPFLSNPAGKKS